MFGLLLRSPPSILLANKEARGMLLNKKLVRACSVQLGVFQCLY